MLLSLTASELERIDDMHHVAVTQLTEFRTGRSMTRMVDPSDVRELLRTAAATAETGEASATRQAAPTRTAMVRRTLLYCFSKGAVLYPVDDWNA